MRPERVKEVAVAGTYRKNDRLQKSSKDSMGKAQLQKEEREEVKTKTKIKGGSFNLFEKERCLGLEE